MQPESRRPGESRQPGESWTPRSLRDGRDPDPRFSLANERTFLAWVRSGLALIALGIAVATFVSTTETRGASVLLAVSLIVLGGALSAVSWLRWIQVERALRHGRGIPPTTLGLALAIGIAVLAVVAVITVLIAG